MQLPLPIRRRSRKTEVRATRELLSSGRESSAQPNPVDRPMLLLWQPEQGRHVGTLARGGRHSVRPGASRHCHRESFQRTPNNKKNQFCSNQITLPAYIESIRDKLAENIHEMWAMNKIEAGWSYGERRDDVRHIHPCLTQFNNLPPAEKRYDSQLAVQTLK